MVGTDFDLGLGEGLGEGIGGLEELSLDNDILNGLEDGTLESFGEVDTNIDFPHFKITTKDMKDAVNALSKIASTGGRDVLTKSLSFKVEKEILKIRATDFDVHAEKSITVLNNEKILDDHVVIPLALLQKVLKATPTFTIIFKDGADYFIRLVGGDMLLETYTTDVERYSPVFNTEKVGKIDSKELNTLVKDLAPIVATAISPTEKRILLGEEGAVASYMLALVQSKAKYPVMDLKTKDIQVLNTLTNSYEGDLDVYTSVNTDVVRRVIKCDNFSYTFLVSDKIEKSPVYDRLEAFPTDAGVHIDVVHFYKMAELAADLPFSAGRVKLKYSEKGLNLTVITKKDKDSVFDLDGSTEGNCSKDVVCTIQATLLKTLLKVFARSTSVKVSLMKEGIAISTDNYKAILVGE